MKYLLDANACIRYLNSRAPKLMQRLRATPTDEIALCAVVKAELFYGAMKSRNALETLNKQQQFFAPFISLPFDDIAAGYFGEVRAELERLGTPIGAYDLQIAAIALANNLTLVTANVREFSRVRNLKIEDWEASE